MKRLLTYAVVWFVTAGIYAYGNLEKSDGSDTRPKALPRSIGEHILGIAPSDTGELVITTWEARGVRETCVRVLPCDLTGQIHEASEFVVRHVLSIRTTKDVNIPVIWISTADHTTPAELWLAYRHGAKFIPKFLLREDPEENLSLRKCWLFQVGSKKQIFVQKYGFKKTRLKGELQLVPTYWLYCYTLESNGLKLQAKAPIGEGKTESDDLSVECALMDGKVYVWVCEHLGKWRKKGVLRVAQWHNEGELDWTERYKGGYVAPLLSADILDNSAIAIFGRQKNQPYSSTIICQLPGYTPSCANLGCGPGGKHQLLHVQQAGTGWLLSGYEAWNMHILALDDKFRQVKEVKKSYPYSGDVHLVRADDQRCYVVILLQDRIKIEKLEDLPVTRVGPQQELQELSKEMIEQAYKVYIEGEGKDLVNATNDELAKDIITGDEVFLLVSYYRLLSRDEKRAEDCLAKRIATIVKEGVGQEHWLTGMQLASYGEPAVKPLLKIAANGAAGERQIAVEVLYLMPDMAIANELIKLLDRPAGRKDSATCLLICDMGLMAGKPEAMDFLIDAATGKFMENGDVDTEFLLDESRQMLLEITREYENTPQDWSEEAWSQWWTKHRETVKPEKELPAEALQRRKELSRGHLIFQKLAEMLEEKQT